jgi:hypothetical protein
VPPPAGVVPRLYGRGRDIGCILPALTNQAHGALKMANLTTEQIMILIGAVILLFPVARATVPGIVLLVLPTAIRWEFENGPKALERHASTAAVRELLERLKQLAFTPLGVKIEYWPFGSKIRELALGSREARSFASIPVVKHLPQLYYYYYTPFEDGAIALTANGLFHSTERSDYIISVIPGTTPRELLLMHEEAVSKLTGAGHRPLREYTQESRLEATGLFHASIHSKRRLRFAGFVSLLILTTTAGVLGFAAWWIGW